MRTNAGNAFVYGDLKAVDTVTYPEIGGEYIYIEKVKERYTMHTRQVAHTTTMNGKPILTIQRKPIGHGIMLVVRNGYVMKYHFKSRFFS